MLVWTSARDGFQRLSIAIDEWEARIHLGCAEDLEEEMELAHCVRLTQWLDTV